MAGQKIVVVTDSSAYIPEIAMEGLNISVIPLWLLWDGERLRVTVRAMPETGDVLDFALLRNLACPLS